ncbi:protein immune deficiency [Cataglyphis hispanica]|uniref:protein immune deficiency n=1 Tax=Cataglyphis hispanica TaxID=1086592 RepID=UPI00217F961B|nr:protein immune deficiency [Cataglyphis hispanica]
MITSARNVDLPEHSTFFGSKAHRAFKKMPILSQLSRRFHDMLTTDAKPDPPRTGIKDYTHNLPPTSDEELKKTQSTSTPITPEKEHDDNVTSLQGQKSVPNDARPTTPTDFSTKPEDLGDTRSTSDSKEYKRPRTKTKSKQNKYSQGTNVINYNIVNSNGVKIGSRTSYICNINQYPASNNASGAQSEASWSKPKYRSMPENVEELSTCKEELAFNDMLLIKTHIGHGWRDVARRLSYSDGQIEQFEENYRHKGTDEIIYQLLLDWKQANTRDAQLGMLVSILWSCQEYDCVERLAAAHKNSFYSGTA